MVKKGLVFLLVLSMLTCIISVQTYGDAARELKIGAWVGTQPSESEISQFQQLQQKHLDIVHQFISWSTNFDYVRPYADAVYKNGSILMITWEPWEYNTVDINNGRADSYITRMALDIKSYGKEIWLRPLHEANGNWYPWAIGDSKKVNTNETYKAAFRHVVDIFRKNGVSNVKWVYNVNCSNVGDGTSFLDIYPGDNYVDYTSIDGYNWGTTQSWGSVWQTFDQIFLQAYTALKAINKPMIIAEWASTEVGGNKAKWITESFDTIRTSYDKIFATVWFSQNKETDWRINSSESALQSYRTAIGTIVPTPTPTIVPTLTPTVIPTPTHTVVPSPSPTSGDFDFKVETSFNPARLVANQMLTAKASVTNTSSTYYSGNMDVLAIVALYDANNTMVNVSYISKGIPYHGTEILSAGFKLPSNIQGYSVKSFVWDGTDLKTSNMIPLSNIQELK